MKTVTIGILAGAAVVGMTGITVLAGFGFGSNLSKYETFSYGIKTGEEIHVVGKWVRQDESAYDSEKDLFTFYMQDSTKGQTLVKYYDPMPVNFKSADKIVVQGKYKDNAFVADKIFMKCPSKYNETEIKMEQEMK